MAGRTAATSSTARARWRAVVTIAVIAGAVPGFATPTHGQAATDACASPVRSPVACENTRPGHPASEWDLRTRGAGDPTLQGFATQISVVPGRRIEFKVDTTAPDYRLDIYRMGFYGGAGARRVTTVAPSAPLPQPQPPCLSDSATGLVDCGNWAVSAAWDVPAGAVSGIYFAHLVRPDTGGDSHILFIVRDEQGRSDLLVQTPDTTWAAYNAYGGNSLYEGAPAGRAHKVSYNRPDIVRGGRYARTNPFDDVYPMVRFLEANGYDLSYTTGVDVDRDGVAAGAHRAFLAIGHDEYWSADQRAAVERVRDGGTNLAFFTGNGVFWKTRWEPSIDGSGTDRRTLVSYKETTADRPIDPAGPGTWTGTWRDPRFSPPGDGGRPENALTGTIFQVNCCQYAPLTVSPEEGRLRFWRDTGLDRAPGPVSMVPGLVGYEVDVDADNAARPAGQIAMSSTRLVGHVLLDHGDQYETGTAAHSITYHRAPSGALVFGAGTIHWSWGLDDHHDAIDVAAPAPDDRIRQATVNVLADMGAQPVTRQPGLVPAAPSTDRTAPASAITPPAGDPVPQAGYPLTVTGTATDAGGEVGGVEVSTDDGRTWHPASGRSRWTYAFIPPAAGTYTIRARATDDSLNTEVPGAGVTVTVVPRVCPCSLFPPATVPVNETLDDGRPLELGMRFRAREAGWVTGVRFYKNERNTGSHVGSLWTATGRLLSSVTFGDESASGWQQATFATPVQVEAGTPYVVSYHSPTGWYSGDNGVFLGRDVATDLLVAPASTHEALNGLYREGDSGFPTSSWLDSNYYVDVSFWPGPTPPPGGPPTTTTTRPPGSTTTTRPTTTTTTTRPPVTTTTVPSGPCPCTLFGTATPARPDVAEGRPVTLGLRVRPTRSGAVTGVRFYKSAENTGSHVGRLWTADGRLLAEATFAGERASGWQTAPLPAPVPVVAGTTYVVSYHSTTGHYSADNDTFAGRSVTAGPLVAPASTADAPNGVYTYAADGFPTSTYRASNYYVDVVFDG